MKSKELYKVYRPRKFKDIIGQKEAVKILRTKIEKEELPHTILLSGPSGTGKTTIARILVRALKCSRHDFVEANNADLRGIEEVRKIRNVIQLTPLRGDCRVWLIDEAHKLTNDAQNAFLKMLEDTPDHVYFIFCTTEPEKLLKTIRTRSTEIGLHSLSTKDMLKLIANVSAKAKINLPEEVVENIIENSDGSPRKALVLLDQIKDLQNEDEMLRAIEASTAKDKGEFIGKLLLRPNVEWSELAECLKDNRKEDSEKIRRGVLGYMASVLLNNSGKTAARAFIVIGCFEDNLYNSGFAGLVYACFAVLHGN